MTAYRAAPGKGRAAGVLLIQEIFGVNESMRALADEYSRAGHPTLCPDLFWRQQSNVMLSDRSEAERAQAMTLFQRFDETLGLSDLGHALQRLRSDPECDGRVVVIGYCLGGRLAVAMSAQANITAVVAYYPVGLDHRDELLANVAAPLLVHLGEADPLVPANARTKIVRGLAVHRDTKVIVHANAGHAFARRGGMGYQAAQAAEADRATANFLARSLA